MPGGNGMGPMGLGPMTGRGAGYCAGYRTPGYRNWGPGRGAWFGRGRGYRQMFWVGSLLPGVAYLAYRWANRSKQQ